MAKLRVIKGAARGIERKGGFPRLQPIRSRFSLSGYPPLLELPGSSCIGNRLAIFRSKSISDFWIAIAITIPIKNHSGKIADRFSFRNRSAIFRSKSISEFHFEIDQRLKSRSQCIPTDGAINRGAIFVRKSISDFRIKIDQRFSF